MNERTFRILELDKILAVLAGFAVSEPGARLCASAQPHCDLATVRHAQEETAAADTLWAKQGGNPMESYFDCTVAAARCATGALPTTIELLQIAQTLKAVRIVKDHLREAEGPVHALALRLAPQRYLEEEIFRCILAEDEIADTASSTLRDLRRAIRAAHEKIRSRLQNIITSSEYKTALQDTIITQRNGRYVVPVKAEHIHTLRGLEHDRSHSGATVFIEPLSVLEANNELRELQAKERQEVERILRTLGGMAGSVKEEIAGNVRTLAALDFAFAKAALARHYKAVKPIVQDGDTLCITAARHPLIDTGKVVPIDVSCGGEVRALIVTGPNTGGKTVTLKTTGLLALMAQTGLFLPCEKAEMPVFSDIFADIGDEQSIEQSLSTFSSHMVNIVAILQAAQAGTLVLMDELGAGTDPIEGAALATAILEYVRDAGAVAMVTTHYSELKSFAMTHPGFLNAAMEFDVDTLKPTYRLLTGYAGNSNAFAISKKLGLPESVIQRARDHVDEDAAKVEHVLAKAEQLRLQAKAEYQQAQRHREADARLLEQERAEAEAAIVRERRKLEKLEEKANKQLIRARELAEEAIEEAKRAAKAQSNQERERALQRARDIARTISPEQEETAVQQAAPPATLRAGDTVYMTTTGATATVLTPPDAKGEVTLQAGILKVTAHKDTLRLAEKPKQKSAVGGRVQRQQAAVPMSIDVRGMTVDEAEMVIDQHLDAASLSGLRELSIIHGKGTGALRAGVQRFLKQHPHVKTYRMGAYGEGDAGVTIAELK